MIEKLFKGPSETNKRLRRATTVGFVAAGALLVWLSYIHFHLWQDLGYRHIPTIGPLFLLQSIAGLIVGVLLVIVRRAWIALVGAGFAVATMVGFLISVESGLFGFNDSWSAPFAHQAFVIEIAAVVCASIAGGLCLVGATSMTAQRLAPAATSSGD
jgi:hypothetical protein